MEKHYTMGKILSFIFILILFSGGFLFNRLVLLKTDFLPALQWGLFYALFMAVLFSFLYDLFLAYGYLQVKIRCLKALILFFAALLVINLFIKGSFIFKAVSALLFYVVLLFAGHRQDKKRLFVYNEDTRLPRKYLAPHPFKSLLETIFRLFPYPEPVGLYAIGNPGREAPVIVTGNYELTIRRVAGALAGGHYYLLVCDSRGVNIWCSTLAGHFSTASITGAIRRTGLAERVSRRRIILPQLCAAGIDVKKVREETGFGCEFGPVHINHLAAWQEDKKPLGIRLVTFSLKERLEMAAGTIIIPSILLLFLFNFLGLHHLFFLLPTLYLFSFINAATFPLRVIKNIRLRGLFWALAGLTAVLLCSLFFPLNLYIYGITIPVLFFYLVCEFEGWSPMVKFDPFGSYTKASVYIDRQKCSGCRTCLCVCPKGVFGMEEKRAMAIRAGECISCRSCFFQCPSGAIRHSAVIRDKK